MTDNDARLSTVEARLNSLEADREIRQLLARYAINADQGRRDEWSELFVEGGALDLALPATWSSAAGDETSEAEQPVRHEGRDQLRRFMDDPKGHDDIEGRCLHLMDVNLATSVEGDTATAESYNLTLVREGSDITLRSASVNRWKLARVDGKWRIEECFRRRPGAPGFESVNPPTR